MMESHKSMSGLMWNWLNDAEPSKQTNNGSLVYNEYKQGIGKNTDMEVSKASELHNTDVSHCLLYNLFF